MFHFDLSISEIQCTTFTQIHCEKSTKMSRRIKWIKIRGKRLFIIRFLPILYMMTVSYCAVVKKRYSPLIIRMKHEKWLFILCFVIRPFLGFYIFFNNLCLDSVTNFKGKFTKDLQDILLVVPMSYITISTFMKCYKFNTR